MRTPPILPRAIVIVGLALSVGCGNPAASGSGASAAASAGASAAASPPAATALWPAPPDPMARTIEAGLKPEAKEFLANHVHAHLDVFVDGKPIVVPAGIGIDTANPDVRRFDEPDGGVSYGGIKLCAKPCISPLHTHDASGIIHTESAVQKPNTLGELFVEWGVALSDTCVGEFCSPKAIAVYVDGELVPGDPRSIELTDRKEVAIVIGTPPPVIPKTADFSNA